MSFMSSQGSSQHGLCYPLLRSNFSSRVACSSTQGFGASFLIVELNLHWAKSATYRETQKLRRTPAGGDTQCWQERSRKRGFYSYSVHSLLLFSTFSLLFLSSLSRGGVVCGASHAALGEPLYLIPKLRSDICQVVHLHSTVSTLGGQSMCKPKLLRCCLLRDVIECVASADIETGGEISLFGISRWIFLYLRLPISYLCPVARARTQFINSWAQKSSPKLSAVEPKFLMVMTWKPLVLLTL